MLLVIKRPGKMCVAGDLLARSPSGMCLKHRAYEGINRGTRSRVRRSGARRRYLRGDAGGFIICHGRIWRQASEFAWMRHHKTLVRQRLSYSGSLASSENFLRTRLKFIVGHVFSQTVAITSWRGQKLPFPSPGRKIQCLSYPTWPFLQDLDMELWASLGVFFSTSFE